MFSDIKITLKVEDCGFFTEGFWMISSMEAKKGQKNETL